MTTQSVETAMAGSVDGNALATALRKVAPFAASTDPNGKNLQHVWLEVDGGFVGLTATDGYRMAHASLEADLPNGQWLLDGQACKGYGGSVPAGEVEASIDEERLRVGEQSIPVVGTAWIEYKHIRELAEADVEGWAIFSRLALTRALKDTSGTVVGLHLSETAGCKLYVAKDSNRKRNGYVTADDLETTACIELVPQMVSGEVRVAFDADRLSRAIRCFDDSVTIKAKAGEKPAFLEGVDYWQVVVPSLIFPHEVDLSEQDRQAIEWLEEMLKSIRKGQVKARIGLGRGSAEVAWEPTPERTVISVLEA